MDWKTSIGLDTEGMEVMDWRNFKGMLSEGKIKSWGEGMNGKVMGSEGMDRKMVKGVRGERMDWNKRWIEERVKE